MKPPPPQLPSSQPPPRTLPPGEPLDRIKIPPEEALKRGEIHTRISRGAAWGMIASFVALLMVVSIGQGVTELTRGERPQALEVFGRAPTRANLRAYERSLEEASLPRSFSQPRLQALLCRAGFGNSNVVIGRAGWLFYRPGVDLVAGAGFLEEATWARRRRDEVNHHRPITHADPRPAILQFHRICEEAGAQLILLPVPDKAGMQPAQLSRRFPQDAAIPPLVNACHERLLAELRAAGVEVFDPTPQIITPGVVRYLAQDTHWTPQWMEAVAMDLAARVESVAALGPADQVYGVKEVTVSRVGDLVDMLRLPADQKLFPPHSIVTRRVTDAEGDLWRPRRDAQVLLLGDSFTNIYSTPPMGWGESAGLAEHLSRALGRPVDRISRNDHGAYATRQMLADDLARGRDRLGGKKVVIWQFAARELLVGDWRPIEMKLAPPRPAKFFVPAAGETVVVNGIIEDIAPAPIPGSVPYRDHIVAAHLTDLSSSSGTIDATDALVYMWSMRDNVWTPAARYQPGQRITLRLRPWAEVAEELETINRAEVADEAVQLEEPAWGEEVMQ